MSSDSSTRIIVKRHHAAHDDEHGGQWKIAYADFVTAMMAFFLVMWLLSSTTEEQREGIANFFNSSSPTDMPAGTGALNGGRSVLTAGDAPRENPSPEAEGGVPAPLEADATPPVTDTSQDNTAAAIRNQIERQRFEALKAEIERMMTAANGGLQEFAQHLLIEMTPEGLRLQITDRDGAPMFNAGAADPTPRLNRILAVVGSVLATVPNEIVVAGHTDAQPLNRGIYGNWELSSDRANNSRRVLERSGVGGGRIFRVEGKAGSEPLLTETPNDARNRRIAVTVLRTEVAAAARAAGRRVSPIAGVR